MVEMSVLVTLLAYLTICSFASPVSGMSSPIRFNTRAFSNLSPVSHYELIHEDQAYDIDSGPVLRGVGMKSHVFYPFASKKTRSFQGMTQHFPNSLRLVVEAFDKVHDLELHLLTHLKGPNAVINGDWGSMPSFMNTYQTLEQPASIVTFRPDGSFEAMIRYYNSSSMKGWEWESVQITHIEQHAGETLSSFDYQTMALSSPHGMVAHKLSEANSDYFSKMKCGTNHDDYHPQHNHYHQLAYNDPTIGICNGIPCRFPDNGNAGTPCWPNIASLSSMSTGILCDYGYTQIFAGSSQSQTITNTALAVDQTMALVNSIYVPTLNIYNRVDETKVMAVAAYNSATDPSTLSWNRAPQDTTNTGAPATNAQNCQTDSINGGWTINNALTAVINYNAQDKVNGVIRFGERHLFTNCWPLLASTGSGTVGLASLGALAQTDGQSSGVSTYTGSHWITIAHEMGHNYGAPHTFGADGTNPSSSITGKVGGIMDYNDPSNPPGVYPLPSVNANGIVQFHPQLSKPPICTQITTTYNGRGKGSYLSTVLQPFTPTCGNGVVEPGEFCDDTTGCCGSNCQLILNAQCTPNALSPCCDNTCLYRPTSYGCKGSSSYCANGKCVPNGCNAFSNTANCPIATGGISGGDGCNFYCDFNSGSGCSNGQGGSLQVSSFGTVPDGIVCSTAATKPSFGYGVCSGNPTGSKTGSQSTCTKTTAPPAPNPGGGPTTTPTTAGAGTPAATTAVVPTTVTPTTAAATTAAPACVTNANCVSCVDDPQYYCGWCPSTNKCVTTDSTGVAGTGVCPVAVYFDNSAAANNGAAVCNPTTAAPTTVTPTTPIPTTAKPTTIPPSTATPTTVPATTAKPTTVTPTTPTPTTASPTTPNPTTATPTTATPSTAKATTATPTTVPPTTATPTTATPTTVTPSTAKATTATATTVTPTTATPTTSTPSSATPSTVAPTTAKPTTTNPSTARPTSSTATTSTVTTATPTTGTPTTQTSTTNTPTTASPTTNTATTSSSTTSNTPTTVVPTGQSTTTSSPSVPTSSSPTTSVSTTAPPTSVVTTATVAPSTAPVATTQIITPTIPGDISIWLLFFGIGIPNAAWEQEILAALLSLFQFKSNDTFFYLVKWSTFSSPHYSIQAAPSGQSNVWVQVALSSKAILNDGTYTTSSIISTIQGSASMSALRSTLPELNSVSTTEPNGNYGGNNNNESNSSSGLFGFAWWIVGIVIGGIVLVIIIVAVVVYRCMKAKSAATESLAYLGNSNNVTEFGIFGSSPSPVKHTRNITVDNFKSNPIAGNTTASTYGGRYSFAPI